MSSACTDAFDAIAFKAVDRYCSDGSNRAPVAAPLKPHVVWSRPISFSGSLLVGEDGTGYVARGNGVSAVRLSGDDAWVASPPIPWGSNALLAGRIDTSDVFDSTRTSRSQKSGAVLGTSSWPLWAARVAVDDVGGSFVELIELTADGSTFDGIARVSPDGTTQWIESGGCDPGGDFPAPHDFVRRDDHLLLVCNTHDAVEALEVDANDAEVWRGSFDGALSGNVAIASHGDLAFFVDLGSESTSLVTITRDHGTELGGPALAGATIVAVAQDGTLVVSTKDGVAAIAADRALRWQQQVALPHETFVDSNHTIVTASNRSVIGLDLASGAKLWEVVLSEDVVSLASAGPGKIYVASESTLTLVSD